MIRYVLAVFHHPLSLLRLLTANKQLLLCGLNIHAILCLGTKQSPEEENSYQLHWHVIIWHVWQRPLDVSKITKHQWLQAEIRRLMLSSRSTMHTFVYYLFISCYVSCHTYFFCVSPAFTVILPTVSCGPLLLLPQGIMVLTLLHMFAHIGLPYQVKRIIIRSPMSVSRVMRNVKVLLPEISSVLK